jgi:ABC-2 type transport system permease protein
MRKYLQLANLTFQDYFVYRLNFYLWRFRSFITFLTLLFFWLAIYGNQASFLGYQKSQMITYVVGVAFLRTIIFGTRSTDLAPQIRSGSLTKLLLKPIKVFKYFFTQDVVDKLLNFLFAGFEIGLVLFILNFSLYFPQKMTTYFFFFVLVSLAIVLLFFISMTLSIISFWTEEIWAARFLFMVIFMEFLAGTYFPLDILPSSLSKIIYLTPSPYLIFFPMKIWLEQLSFEEIVKAILICFVWLLFFWWFSFFLWKKGSRSYSAYGD